MVLLSALCHTTFATGVLLSHLILPRARYIYILYICIFLYYSPNRHYCVEMNVAVTCTWLGQPTYTHQTASEPFLKRSPSVYLYLPHDRKASFDWCPKFGEVRRVEGRSTQHHRTTPNSKLHFRGRKIYCTIWWKVGVLFAKKRASLEALDVTLYRCVHYKSHNPALVF